MTLWPLVMDSWDGEEQEAMIRHLRDGKRLTIGDECAAFEREFEEWHNNTRIAATCNSGSSANLLAVAALTEKPETWIVPALGWATTYAPLHQYGHKMIVLDVGDDFCINYDQLERHAHRAQGIMVVHPLGVCADMTRIMDIATRHNLKVIEDTCESLGAKHNGRYAGTFGDIGTFSFYFSHHISTIEGGMVLSNKPTLDSRIRALRSHGWSRGLQALHSFPIEHRYRPFDMVLPGYNLRLTDLQAVAGRVQLRKLNTMLYRRRKNERYVFETLFEPWYPPERINGMCYQHTRPVLGGSSSFAIALVDQTNRPMDRVLRQLTEHGIEHRPIIMGSLLEHAVSKLYNLDVPEPLTKAKLLHDRGFYIGNWPKAVTNEQLDALRSALK